MTLDAIKTLATNSMVDSSKITVISWQPLLDQLFYNLKRDMCVGYTEYDINNNTFTNREFLQPLYAASDLEEPYGLRIVSTKSLLLCKLMMQNDIWSVSLYREIAVLTDSSVICEILVENDTTPEIIALLKSRFS